MSRSGSFMQDVREFVFVTVITAVCTFAVINVGLWMLTSKSAVPKIDEVAVCADSKTETHFNTPVCETEFISGPPAANTGDLCVFQISDPKIRADWTVVRHVDGEAPVPLYVDSSGSSLAFSSNIPARYTIVAAVCSGGNPKILRHVCQYGVTPQPEPKPPPNPEPEPVTTLTEWVRRNIPEAAQAETAALADCYRGAVEAIENERIRTVQAAFSSVRTNTQTKITLSLWQDFLDELSKKITAQHENPDDVESLGVIFRDIAEGLKSSPEDNVPIIPSVENQEPCVTCPSPTRTSPRLQGSRLQPYRYR